MFNNDSKEDSINFNPGITLNIRQKTNYISGIVLLVCLLLALIIYLYTGNVIIAIFFAPPIIHWILKRREKKNR